MSYDPDKPDIETPEGILGLAYASRTAMAATNDNRALQRMRQSYSSKKIINASASMIFKNAQTEESLRKQTDPDYKNELANMPKAMERAAIRFQERIAPIEGDKHYLEVEAALNGSPSTSPAGVPEKGG